MKFFKKLALFLAATAAAAYLIFWTFESFGLDNPFFAFLVNWLVMSWVAIVGQAVPFSFPAGYYQIQSFERTGRIYERLGVHLFKKLVRRGPLAVFNPKLRLPKERTLSALQNLEGEMRNAETAHLFIFLVMLLFTGYALFQGWFATAGWFLLFNLLLNGYPVMLQRYNRIRLQQLIRRQAA